uniref:eIF-4F 25 kDa subunit n=1 Tax=Nelumbo nucifera TaxID=4432 RepID=A0A822Z844_NELNU|nr:TPA_asm: hypothetical protein HUJ06_008299 [Nelumbo nucifera]
MAQEVESVLAVVGSKATEEENDGVVGGGGSGVEEPEEREVVGDDLAFEKSSTTAMYQPHPLEYSWTFWFDNPSSKSKQAAWGASIRPIHTFATVEEFWRCSSIIVSIFV